MDIGEKIWVITGRAGGVILGLAMALPAHGGQVFKADLIIALADPVAEELSPKACAATVDVNSTDSPEALAAHVPQTLESEKYNVLEVVKRLRSENG